MPLFTVILVHYQGTVPHEVFLRAVRCLEGQTFRDFEVLCFHDGPLLDAAVAMPLPVICTERRFNDWGGELRDRGIKRAAGEYIVHFNADNILYPEALEEVAKEIRRGPRLVDANGNVGDTNEIIIFPILMHGLVKFRQWTIQVKEVGGGGGEGQDFCLIFNGMPPVAKNIDCMQLVMKRELWLREGGWFDRRDIGDGVMYEAFCGKYGYRYVGRVLGEHY